MMRRTRLRWDATRARLSERLLVYRQRRRAWVPWHWVHLYGGGGVADEWAAWGYVNAAYWRAWWRRFWR